MREECRLRVHVKRMLRKIFGPKRGGGKWRKLHHGELTDLYSSPKIIRVIKSRRMRWAWNVALNAEGDRCIQDFSGET